MTAEETTETEGTLPRRRGMSSTEEGASEVSADTADESHEPDTFPREYVEKLRDESAKYRTRAQRADDLAQRLHVALVAATGRLADPSDLAYDDAHLEDPAALEAAIDRLVATNPHLASRRPVGDVGQGATPESEPVSLAGILRTAAS